MEEEALHNNQVLPPTPERSPYHAVKRIWYKEKVITLNDCLVNKELLLLSSGSKSVSFQKLLVLLTSCFEQWSQSLNFNYKIKNYGANPLVSDALFY